MLRSKIHHASESTSLLPSTSSYVPPLLASKTYDRWKFFITGIVLILGVTPVMFRRLGPSVNQISKMDTGGSTVEKSLGFPPEYSDDLEDSSIHLALDDSTLALWEQWKEEISSFWDTASQAGENNAQKFVETVQSWWTNANADLRPAEKIQTLQHNFQDWWSHANYTERCWWNATVQELQRDRQVGADWWDKSEEFVNKEEVVVKTAGQKWWDENKQHLLHDKNVLDQKNKELEEKGKVWWNEVSQQVREEDQLIAKKERIWWNATKQSATQGAEVADEKFLKFWNHTQTIAAKEWNTTAEKEEEWWLATKDWFRQHIQNQNELDPSQIPLIYLNNSRAYSLLMNGDFWYDFSADFFLLQSGLDVQINQAYCAVASVAAILNSLRELVSLPVDPTYEPYSYATQSNILNECVRQNVIFINETFNGILNAPGGLSLYQTKRLLECQLDENNWSVTSYHVNPENVTIDNMHRSIQNALRHPTKRVLANFDRSELGQHGRGHWAPIVGYSKTDNVYLLAEVAKFKGFSFWVPANRLFRAMGTTDNCGHWAYPDAQVLLSTYLLQPNSSKIFRKAMKQLGCEVAFRGYIIVEQIMS